MTFAALKRARLALRAGHVAVQRQAANGEAAGKILRRVRRDQRAVERTEREDCRWRTRGRRRRAPPRRTGKQPLFGVTRQPLPQCTATSSCGDEVAHLAIAKRAGDARRAAQIDAAAALGLHCNADVQLVGGDACVLRAPVCERERAVGFERRVRRPVHGVEQKRSVRRAAADEFERDGAVQVRAGPLQNQVPAHPGATATARSCAPEDERASAGAAIWKRAPCSLAFITMGIERSKSIGGGIERAFGLRERRTNRRVGQIGKGGAQIVLRCVVELRLREARCALRR